MSLTLLFIYAGDNIAMTMIDDQNRERTIERCMFDNKVIFEEVILSNNDFRFR